ncbi:short chain dehydrogenase [Kovacikia minuta CCNUW1]|uniref:short chain dehydrogenase n=1 Tax=Kovacikia minuta TaxID=2931930 RepID=UPI001CCAB7F1|nr:short chain dehydrogenase [Kovacikia minuta]UBF27871.1 short chain dehydrogenase [Kovacikia minuta CCNUW1]
MRIIVVGGTGTIGQAVVQELAPRHEIVTVGKSAGDFQVDITSTESIKNLFEQVGAFDALVSTTGSLHFGPFEEMDESHFYQGIQSKLMGQVNLVLIGRSYINDAGSFTLTSGILSHDPIRFGASASMVNAAIDGFVIGAAIELKPGIRINSVSPGIVQESMEALGSYFRGHNPVPVARVALAYSKSVEGLLNGQVFHVI